MSEYREAYKQCIIVHGKYRDKVYDRYIEFGDFLDELKNPMVDNGFGLDPSKEWELVDHIEKEFIKVFKGVL